MIAVASAVLRQFASRKAAYLLTAAFILVAGIYASQSYGDLRKTASLLEVAAGAEDLVNGVCVDSGCYRPATASFPLMKKAGFPRTLSPEERTQLTEQLRPVYTSALRAQHDREAENFSPRALLGFRMNLIGSLPGAVFGMVLAATLLGNEWRWGIWPTWLPHEPRRSRQIVGRLAALGITWVLAMVACLGALTALDAILRSVNNVTAAGGPSWGALMIRGMSSLLTAGTFAVGAGAFALASRSSLAAFAAPLALLVIDGLATRTFAALRHVLPVQQVTALIPRTLSMPHAVIWWGSPVGQVCEGGGCIERPLPLIPQPRAAAVLGLWLVGAAIAAVAIMRNADVR